MGQKPPKMDKKQCWECKYHTYLGNLPSGKTFDELTELELSNIACYRSVITGETCLKRDGKKIYDSRGDSKCPYWQKDDRSELKASEQTFGKWGII